MKRSQEADLRAQILAEISRLNAQDGRPPGVERFTKATRISQYQVHRYWAGWSDALAEAGFLPNALNAQIPEDELLRRVVELTRSIGRAPSRNYVVHAALSQPGFPHHSTLMRRFGSQQSLLAAILRWTQRNPGNDDVATIIERLAPSKRGRATVVLQTTVATSTAGLSDSYVPPVLACLDDLAIAAPDLVALCRAIGRDENSEFERRVCIAFEIIGLSVERLGQGYGRVADGVAKCPSRGWAILYDAKVRRDGYKLLTEDRKFREYIETHVPPLRKQGLQRCYFAIVSSTFAESDLGRAHELARLTDVKSCVFLEVSALVKIAERRIREGNDTFDLDAVERLFSRTGIVRSGDVSTKNG